MLDLAAAANNTTGSILELKPFTASQATPVQTFGIASTGSTPMRFSNSGTSSFLADTNDRSLLTFAAYETTVTTGDLATQTGSNVRAVGTLNSSGSFTLQTNYTESTSGNQTRAATSLDNSHWFITDKGGLFTNGATTASLTTNILSIKSFGGTVYVSSTAATSAVSTVSSPTATNLSGLSGIGSDGNIQDFYLIQSGSNGSTYDILYILDQGSSVATIKKFSLVNGSWVSNGNIVGGTTGSTNSILNSNAGAMIAANDGAGGAVIYVTTGKGTANNSLAMIVDSAGYNQTINVANANNVTLYTDTASDFMKGLDFVPGTATTPVVASPTKANIGINTATLGGTVTSTGGQFVTEYGVVYALTSTNNHPQIGGTGVTKVSGS